LKILRTFLLAVLAGMAIAIGGTVMLSVENRVLGALLFSTGLFAVCTMGLNLYTGKVCYVFHNPPRYLLDVAVIWLGNFLGTWLVAQSVRLSRIGPALAAKAEALCQTKLEDGAVSIFLLSALCNILIYLGVESYKKNPHELGKYLGIVFGVMVFILCGFEHCVANMYYFSVAGLLGGRTLALLLLMTLGNAFGGVVFPVLRKLSQPREELE